MERIQVSKNKRYLETERWKSRDRDNEKLSFHLVYRVHLSSSYQLVKDYNFNYNYK